MTKSLSFLTILISLLNCISSQGQSKKYSRLDSPVVIHYFQGQIAYQLPVADLKNRYGGFSSFGIAYHYKSAKNIALGVEYNFIFGENVKENPLESISTSVGYLINSNGQLQTMRYQMRGNLFQLDAGKIFPIGWPNVNSGISAKIGIGAMEHKIKYYLAGNAPQQISGEYLKGYDRLTAGLCLNQSIGFTHFSTKNLLNFSFELGSYQGFTSSKRSWNFDSNAYDDKKRLDVSIYAKLGILIPLYGKQGVNVYYY
ncbi:MAG: hypothetical protein SGJ04_01495 [Bacteroidota bacterium]|nr:hypothetical protein [Bacteroidota bacterium]